MNDEKPQVIDAKQAREDDFVIRCLRELGYLSAKEIVLLRVAFSTGYHNGEKKSA